MGALKLHILNKVLAVALPVFMAACSQSNVLEADAPTATTPISFTTYVNRTSTRAAQTDITADGIGDIKVSATGSTSLYFKDEIFKKNDQSKWVTTSIYYWPGYKLSFYAYVEPTAGGTSVVSNVDGALTDDLQSLTIKTSTTLSTSEDIVAAYVNPTTDPSLNGSGATAVPLKFNHCLTRLELKATNQSNVYTIKVLGAKIANLADSGAYMFKSGDLTVSSALINTAKSKDYISTMASAVTLDKTAKSVLSSTDQTAHWYLMPQTCTAWDMQGGNPNNGTYLALKVMITSQGGTQVYPSSGTEYMWVAVPKPADLNFKMGTKYCVTLNFFANNGVGYQDPEQAIPVLPGAGNPIFKTEKPISFDATYSMWDEVENIDINL